MNTSAEPNWNDSLGIRWGAVAFLVGAPLAALLITPYYIAHFGVHWLDVAIFLIFFILSNTAISAGYHRHFSHQAYECHPVLQWIYLVLGTLALQFSVIDWSRNHRIHHQYADTELDPHNIRKGFLHAHVYWVVHETPLDSMFTNIPDLLQNKLCVWQKKYYWAIFSVMTLLLPTLIGSLVGRPFGGFLWGALIRLVVQGHVSYSINSFAHTFGRRPYSIQTEARDSWILALITNGEGFHNFHHRFASDYRNGWKWYQWDPTKWMIHAFQWVGLTWELKKATQLEVLKAQLLVDSQLINKKLLDLPIKEQTRSTWQEGLLPVRKQIEKMAVQMQTLKQEIGKSAEAQSLEIKERYRQQKQSFYLALSEWRKVMREVRRLKGEQLDEYLDALLNQRMRAAAFGK